jgi:hypothetical protein
MNISKAHTIVAALAVVGIQAVIAGGYARDIALKRTPRDIDIIVPRADELAVFMALLDIHLDWVHYAEGASCTQPEVSDRLKAVFSCKELGIDVIMYRASTVMDCLDEFDFNINQFILLNGLPEFMGEAYGFTLSVRGDDVTEERYAKIEALANEVGWPMSRDTH